MSAPTVLPHEALLWQPRPRTHLVTVAAKATFILEPGELVLADEQEPITREEVFYKEDPSRSLLAASDVVPSKPRCDVVVVGHAYANDDRGAQHVVARLCLGSIDKRIDVVADRAVGDDGTVYQGTRFQMMPLLYERAAGGPGTWNPVGVRSTSRDAYGRAPLPNLVPFGKVGETAALPEPIGFGPICATWKLRADKLGYHAFGPTGWAGEPLPEGFDLGYFNAAPPDQQLDQLPEDTTLVLEHLHVEHAKLTCALPGIRPRVTVERRGGPERPMMRPDTLRIDTDRALVTVTWRGHFSLEHEAETYRIRVEVERPTPSWRTMPHAVPGRGSPEERTSRETLVDSQTGSTTWNLPPSRNPARTADAKKPATIALPFREGAPDPRTGALPFANPVVTRAMPSAPPGLTPGRAGLPFGGASAFVPPPPPSSPLQPPPPPPSSPGSFAPLPPMPSPVAHPIAPPTPPPPAPAEAWARPPIPAPPPAVPMHGSAAALGGLVSASNAAADPARRGDLERPQLRISGDVLQLVWFQPELAARARKKPEWKKIIDRLELVRFDPDADHPDLAGDPAALEEQREVFAVLSKGTPGGQDAVDSAMLESMRADGRFAAQVLLLAGELRFDFDETELLKATVTTARPFTDADENLKKAVDAASGFFASPDIVASPEVASAMTARVREAFQTANRPVAATFLDEQSERVLLEKRALQKREVFGGPHARATLFFSGGSSGIPAYLPWAVAGKLPLFRRLRVRTLVEVHFQADQYESHAAALKVVALARVVR